METGVPLFVKSFRVKSGYTQADLARILKVHPQYVSNVERGKYPAPIEFCVRLMRHLNTTDADRLDSMVREDLYLKVEKRLKKRKR